MKRSAALTSLSRDHHAALVGEHVEIRCLAGRLAEESVASPAACHRLGELLAAHVRREERTLFPLLEREMPAAALLAVARALIGARILMLAGLAARASLPRRSSRTPSAR